MSQEPNIVLEGRGLGKRFAGFDAVSDVDLKVRRRSLHALIGPNGAGKTTVFNLLTRFLDPTTGSVNLLGEDITRMSPSHAACMGMVRSFQISAVFPSLTALENVRLSVQRRLHRASFAFWQSPRALYRFNDEAMGFLEQVGLSRMAQVPSGELSYGNRRILELAVTIAMDPKVVLLDEPMAGVGREEIARLSELIQALRGRTTVLMVEHNLSVVSAIADEVTVLARGRVIAHGSYDEIANNPQVIESYIGASAT